MFFLYKKEFKIFNSVFNFSIYFKYFIIIFGVDFSFNFRIYILYFICSFHILSIYFKQFIK